MALDLGDEAAVREAAERIGAPVVVQQMVKGGTELLAGIVQDPTFGPLVAFGPGGVLAELIGEAGFRIAPLTDVDAEELLQPGEDRVPRRRLPRSPAGRYALRSPTSSTGSRGSARTCPRWPSSTSIRCIAGPSGCVVVDARVRVARPSQGRRVKTW